MNIRITYHYTIHPATRADIPYILQLIRELAEYEKLAHEVVATEALLERTLFGERAYAEVLLARQGEDVIGFCLFFHNYSTFLGKPGIYIEDIFVRPQARGQGVGKMLFAGVAKIAQARDCGRIEWWVLDWNETARHFYEQMGATPMDEWTVYRLTNDQFERLRGTP